MNTKQAYDIWSEQYDTNKNITRDLEAQALRATLADIPFNTCLEIGCGTGKNTQWLITKAQQVMAIDLSAEMLAKAKEKVRAANVQFLQADITQNWAFADKSYDLVSFSLVLEHIKDIVPIFREAAQALAPGGYVYIGELHPFKQYSGSKARFETEAGVQIVPCFNHHLSDFIQVAKPHGFEILDINEYFDEDDRTTIPRILTLLLRKTL